MYHSSVKPISQAIEEKFELEHNLAFQELKKEVEELKRQLSEID